eukprot:234661_1
MSHHKLIDEWTYDELKSWISTLNLTNSAKNKLKRTITEQEITGEDMNSLNSVNDIIESFSEINKNTAKKLYNELITLRKKQRAAEDDELKQNQISFTNENTNTGKQTVGFYLVDINYGYNTGTTWQLDTIKEFVKNLSSQQQRYYIYVYESPARLVSYQEFMNIPIAHDSDMTKALDELFDIQLPKEKTNDIDFVFLTDGLETLENRFAGQYKQCIQKYENAGGIIDCSAVFVLKQGKETKTTKEIRRLFGNAIVCAPDTMKKNLKETREGITQCNDARKVYKQAQDALEPIRKALLSSTKTNKEIKKDNNIFRKVEKEFTIVENDMKQIENELAALPTDFFSDNDNDNNNNNNNDNDMKNDNW